LGSQVSLTGGSWGSQGWAQHKESTTPTAAYGGRCGIDVKVQARTAGLGVVGSGDVPACFPPQHCQVLQLLLCWRCPRPPRAAGQQPCAAALPPVAHAAAMSCFSLCVRCRLRVGTRRCEGQPCKVAQFTTGCMLLSRSRLMMSASRPAVAASFSPCASMQQPHWALHQVVVGRWSQLWSCRRYTIAD
jgi:hypothetical protein